MWFLPMLGVLVHAFAMCLAKEDCSAVFLMDETKKPDYPVNKVTRLSHCWGPVAFRLRLTTDLALSFVTCRWLEKLECQ